MTVCLKCSFHANACNHVGTRVFVSAYVCVSVDHSTNNFPLILKSDNQSFTWSGGRPHPIISLQQIAFPLKAGHF